ncbi:MAG: ATP-binding cassette domain-containing protein [Actinomycetota bacterium]|nr:ATP-binding cassette domain-containing protein [Actinomycetota bacterium]
MATVTPTPSLELAEGQEAALEVFEKFIPEQTYEGVPLVGRDISKAFGGIKALREVPLIEVPPHSFVGLIGPNGAGKSTLFNVLNGFTTPDTGEIVLFGQDVTKKQPWDRAKLGMSRTFQANHIDLNLSTFDNLLAGAYQLIRGGLFAATFRSRGNHTDEQRARLAARAVARLLDLEPVLNVMARSLDFAAQRRIEIGRSLMSGPRLLLLDEPTAGVDAHEARELVALVKRMQMDLGLAVLLIEHYVQAVMENSNPIYVLDQGTLIAAGTPEEVANDPKVRASYLGED